MGPSTDWSGALGYRVEGFGECIYCGKKAGSEGLHDEHVIPLSLNGYSVIKDANCTECRDLISPADAHLAKTMYYGHRLNIGAKTRNPKKRPRTTEVILEIRGEKKKFEFNSNEAPYITAFPVWPEAGLFRNAPMDAVFDHDYAYTPYYWFPEGIRSRIGADDNEEVKLWAKIRINHDLFARSMIKIAYCNMIYRFGLHGFRRLAAPDMILGKYPALPYFIGRDKHIPAAEPFMHVLADNIIGRGALRVHVVKVRLFANSQSGTIGTPIYHVIVGAPKFA